MNENIYFIRPLGERGPVKIGCSRDVSHRIGQIKHNLPFGIELITKTEGGFDVEKRLHTKFAADHIGGEWFKWSDELGKLIACVDDGSFDPSALPAPKPLRSMRTNKPKGPHLRTVHPDKSMTYTKLQFIAVDGFGVPVSRDEAA